MCKGETEIFIFPRDIIYIYCCGDVGAKSRRRRHNLFSSSLVSSGCRRRLPRREYPATPSRPAKFRVPIRFSYKQIIPKNAAQTLKARQPFELVEKRLSCLS